MNDINETIEIIPRGTDHQAETEKSVWSDMKWRALFCLCDNRGHLPITSLAAMVGLPSHEALVALEAMEARGMIRKTETGYVQTDKLFKRTVNDKNRRTIIEDFAHSTDQALNRLLETPNSLRHQTRSVIYNSKHEIVKGLYEKIHKAIEEFKEESNNAKESWDGVYAINLALVDITGEVR